MSAHPALFARLLAYRHEPKPATPQPQPGDRDDEQAQADIGDDINEHELP